jgi:hypothetical protein
MKSRQQRVPHSGAPTSSSVPNTQLAPLEEVVDRVNSAVEVTTREFQCLTSWLLHRGEHRPKENHEYSHLKNRRGQQNIATGSHQALPRAKREGYSQNPSWEEIQRRQPNNERSQEHHCPVDRLHSSSLSSPYYNWPNHLGRGEAGRDMPNPKGESEEGTPPFGKKATETPHADQVTTPYSSNNPRLPLIKSYDGKGNPASHIDKFQTHPSLCNLPGEIACHIFPLTLEGRAREWFNSLSPCTNFSTIKRQFLRQFSNVPRKKQHPASLFALKQGRTESLTNFVKRFYLELRLVDNPSDQIILSAMINGMKPGEPILAELAGQPATCTLRQFSDKIKAYLQKEEAMKKAGKSSKPKDLLGEFRPGEGSSSRKRKGTDHITERDPFPNQKWTPLNTSLSVIFEEARKDPDFKPPPKMRTPAGKRNNRKYCGYHCDHGHQTEECLSLKKEIERLIRLGRLKNFVIGSMDAESYSYKLRKAEPRIKPSTLEILKGFRTNK